MLVIFTGKQQTRELEKLEFTTLQSLFFNSEIEKTHKRTK